MSVVRNRIPSSGSFIREHWTSETEQEMRDLFEQIEQNYPTPGYGTMLTQICQDPTGMLWQAEFSRLTSCD